MSFLLGGSAAGDTCALDRLKKDVLLGCEFAGSSTEASSCQNEDIQDDNPPPSSTSSSAGAESSRFFRTHWHPRATRQKRSAAAARDMISHNPKVDPNGGLPVSSEFCCAIASVVIKLLDISLISTSLVVCDEPAETNDDGEDVGRELGRRDGRADGEDVGEDDGLLDGAELGRFVGSYEGTAVGVAVGLAFIP